MDVLTFIANTADSDHQTVLWYVAARMPEDTMQKFFTDMGDFKGWIRSLARKYPKGWDAFHFDLENAISDGWFEVMYMPFGGLFAFQAKRQH